jgi:plasmid maintenance system killer protein
MRLFDFLKKRKQPVDDSPVVDYSPTVDQLEALGYFKYTAPGDIPALKEEIISSLKDKWLATLYTDDKPWNSKDYRHYILDNEDLFEEGGFTDKLQDMQALFDKMDFKLEISDHIEEWDNEKGLNHSITINGKNYIIFRNFNDYGWDQAAQRFAEIINDQLELQGKDERLFLINGGNDGRCVFLTGEQYSLLKPCLSILLNNRLLLMTGAGGLMWTRTAICDN